MDSTAKKKYQRTVPRGRTRLLEIPAHGLLLSDVVRSLQGFEERKGQPRCYVDSNGRLIVAVMDYQA